MSEDNGLQDLLLDDRASGKTWYEIEKAHGIPAAEAKAIVNEALMETASKDPVEMRMLMQVRLEKITQHLWAGLEAGSFKHGEAILKAAGQMAELMDLNQETIKKQFTIISDEETLQLFEVLKRTTNSLYEKVNNLPLTQEARAELSQWPEWSAAAATDAVEQVVYAAELED